MRWALWGVCLLLLLATLGCGGTSSVAERTNPMPRERFPRADK